MPIEREELWGNRVVRKKVAYLVIALIVGAMEASRKLKGTTPSKKPNGMIGVVSWTHHECFVIEGLLLFVISRPDSDQRERERERTKSSLTCYHRTGPVVKIVIFRVVMSLRFIVLGGL